MVKAAGKEAAEWVYKGGRDIEGVKNGGSGAQVRRSGTEYGFLFSGKGRRRKGGYRFWWVCSVSGRSLRQFLPMALISS